MKQAKNPIFPSDEYIPDPEAHVFGERVYIFGSHDEFNGTDYCMNDYVCYSASVYNLSDWTYEGVIYKREQHPDKSLKGNLFAPDVAKGPDGKFYLYYVIQDSNTMSVAVCDTPAGQYEYYGECRYEDGHIAGSRPGDYFEFDPAVLVDDTGKIYLYSGSGQKENHQEDYPVVGLFVRELAEDMLTLKTEPTILMPFDDDKEKPNFFEGASVRKIKNRYYLLYFSTDFSGLHYCISDFPDRDFKYGGLVHSATDIGIDGRTIDEALGYVNNNHGSLEEINGQVYVFNHRSANRMRFSRQAVAERITIQKNGSIKQVESTSAGLNNGPFRKKETFPAYIACNFLSPLKNGKRNPNDAPYPTQEKLKSGQNHQYITDIQNGSMIGYKSFDFEVSSILLDIRGQAKGEMLIRKGEREPVIQRVPIDIHTDSWTIIKSDLTILEGSFDLFFEFNGVGTLDLMSFRLT
jgi:hypothetical protein